MRLNKIFLNIFLFALIIALNGCISVATTGSSLIYDNYSIRKKASDRYIAWQVENIIYEDHALHIKGNVSVTVFNQLVLLTGQVPTAQAQQKLIAAVKNIDGIKKLFNQTTVGPPKLGVTASVDSWLTAKIKSRMIIDKEIDPNTIKVVTEDDIVYLIGITTQRQAEAATYIAKHTEGVKKVITIFYYITMPDIK